MGVLEAQSRRRQKDLQQDVPPLYDDLLEQGRMEKHLQQEPPDYGAFLAQQQLSPYQVLYHSSLVFW